MVNEEDINRAFEAVVYDKMSKRGAAKKFNISLSTLRRRLQNGNKSMVSGHEDQMLLTLLEEKVLVCWVINEDSMGQAPTDEEIIQEARRIARYNKRDINPSERWAYNFRHRHPCLKRMSARKLERARKKAINPDSLESFYYNVEKMTKELNVGPDRMYNVDEVGLQPNDSYNKEKVTGASNKSRTYTTVAAAGSHVTYIECICADGTYIDPVPIFKDKNAKTYRYKLKEDSKAPKWVYLNTTSGWSINLMGDIWLSDVFIPNTRPDNENEWRILFMDNHTSHVTDYFKLTCLENKIFPLYLPPHSTHVLQPLDFGCFSSVKSYYKRKAREFFHSTQQSLDNESCAILWNESRKAKLTSRLIRNAFKLTGIYPLDRNIVPTSAFPSELPIQVDENVPKTPVKDNRTFLDELYEMKKKNMINPEAYRIIRNNTVVLQKEIIELNARLERIKETDELRDKLGVKRKRTYKPRAKKDHTEEAKKLLAEKFSENNDNEVEKK